MWLDHTFSQRNKATKRWTGRGGRGWLDQIWKSGKGKQYKVVFINQWGQEPVGNYDLNLFQYAKELSVGRSKRITCLKEGNPAQTAKSHEILRGTAFSNLGKKENVYPASNYSVTRTRCEICSKLIIKTPERRQWCLCC